MSPLARLVRGSAARLALATAAGAGTVAAGVGLLATGAYLIIRAGEHPPIMDLTIAIVGVRFFGVARAVLRYLERLSAHDAALRLVARVRTDSFATIERLSPAGLDQARAGDLLLGVTEDLEQIEQALVRALLPAAVTALTALGAGLVAALLLPTAGYLVGGLLALTAVAAAGAVRLWASSRARLLAEARSDLTAAVIDLVEGAAEAAAFGRAADLVTAAAEADGRLTRLARKMSWTAGAGSALAALGSGLCLWLVARVGIDAVASGRLRPVWLGALALLAVAAFEPAALLPHGWLRLEEGAAAAARLAALEAEPDPVPDPARPEGPPAGAGLELRAASLRHRPGGPWALRAVDLRLEPGRRVALVGESGAGKSTVAQALLRFRDLEAGTYLVGGVDARRLAGATVRSIVGLAAEDAALVAGSVDDNLRLGRPDAGGDEVAAVLTATGLATWAAGLPDGLATLIGPGGREVSGGERRRLSLGRALLAGFPVLVADEPTAGLDGAAAAAVVDALIDAAEERGLLMITHGAEGLARMDEIVVLDRGRVVQRGTHSALLAAAGPYRRFWEARHPGPV